MAMIEVNVRDIRDIADATKLFVLADASGAALPNFDAGSHIDVHIPNGVVRSYSICSAPSRRDEYHIAIKRESAGRGGSAFMHDSLAPGARLEITPPRNNFKLNEGSEKNLFICGGIGITPVYSMIQVLGELDKPWELYYCASSRSGAPFADECQELANAKRGKVHFHCKDECAGSRLDIGVVISEAALGTHLYCCGPISMLEAFRSGVENLDESFVHYEYFSSAEEPDRAGGFDVVLQKSGKTVHVKSGQTILDAILELGMIVPHSCKEGTCGSCEVGVISGEPDHRDSILSDSERARNDAMMICCSGSKGSELVLDL